MVLVAVLKTIGLADDREPWEKQPGESDDQYAAFRKYLESAVEWTSTEYAERHGMSAAVARNLMTARKWERRRKAYLRFEEERHEAWVRASRPAHQRRVVDAAQQMLTIGLQGAAQVNVEEMGGQTAARMVEVGVRAGNSVYGEAATKVDVTGESERNEARLKALAAQVEVVVGLLDEAPPELRLKLSDALAELDDLRQDQDDAL